jgi:cyclic beta-1,2-glucan synthetase
MRRPSATFRNWVSERGFNDELFTLEAPERALSVTSRRSRSSPGSSCFCRYSHCQRSLLNPINHGSTRADIHRYKVEPYVTCVDVYAEPTHVGRGGWTWYTGSAGWTYRAGLEWILGFRLRGAALIIDPCVPTSWPGFEIAFQYHSARYQIAVENPNGVSHRLSRVYLDGKALQTSDALIALSDDGANHKVQVVRD